MPRNVLKGIWKPNKETRAPLANPDVFNLNKNSLGTIGFGLPKFDCTMQDRDLDREAATCYTKDATNEYTLVRADRRIDGLTLPNVLSHNAPYISQHKRLLKDISNHKKLF